MNPGLPDYFAFCSLSNINTFPSTMNQLYMANKTSAVRKSLGTVHETVALGSCQENGPQVGVLTYCIGFSIYELCL